MSGAERAEKGVVFAATGPEIYSRLAARAARSVKDTNPGLPVDLFTDKPTDHPVFDRVHVRQDAWFRSKIEALRYSRFERTLYLDSDIVVLADIGDMFDVLDRFDIALTHDQLRNGDRCQVTYRRDFPNAFPHFNGGVICLKAGPMADAMLAAWADAVREHGIGRDQPSLREMIWNSDLRVATYPPEYNLLRLDMLENWTRMRPAPRIIHSPRFHRNPRQFMNSVDPVTELLGLRLGSKIPLMLATDSDLARRAGQPPLLFVPGNHTFTAKENLGRLAWMLPRLPRRLLTKARSTVGQLLRKAGLR